MHLSALKDHQGLLLRPKSGSENFSVEMNHDGERPMWKPEHRRAADRTGLRYPSDLSDAEWLIVGCPFHRLATLVSLGFCGVV